MAMWSPTEPLENYHLNLQLPSPCSSTVGVLEGPLERLKGAALCCTLMGHLRYNHLTRNLSLFYCKSITCGLETHWGCKWCMHSLILGEEASLPHHKLSLGPSRWLTRGFGLVLAAAARPLPRLACLSSAATVSIKQKCQNKKKSRRV